MDPRYRVRLSSTPEQVLIEYAQGTGVAAKLAKERLLGNYEPLMRRVVKGAGTPPEMRDDALQAARLGFLEALSRYDLSRGVSLGAFARLDIKGRVLRALYVNVRRGVVERRDVVQGVSDASDEEASDSDAEFVRLVSFERGMEKGPMIEQLMLADTERGREQVEDLERVEHEADFSVVQQEIILFIADLPTREQEVVWLVFYKNMSQAAAAREMGISREAVRKILLRVIQKGREELFAYGEASVA